MTSHCKQQTIDINTKEHPHHGKQTQTIIYVFVIVYIYIYIYIYISMIQIGSRNVINTTQRYRYDVAHYAY